jgi:hypothetical protein
VNSATMSDHTVPYILPLIRQRVTKSILLH